MQKYVHELKSNPLSRDAKHHDELVKMPVGRGTCVISKARIHWHYCGCCMELKEIFRAYHPNDRPNCIIEMHQLRKNIDNWFLSVIKLIYSNITQFTKSLCFLGSKTFQKCFNNHSNILEPICSNASKFLWNKIVNLKNAVFYVYFGYFFTSIEVQFMV